MRERDVVAAFARRLRSSGWDVEFEVEHADIVATRQGHRLIVEAKGSTSAMGLDIDTAYGQLLRRMTDDDSTSYALVVPDHAAPAALRVADHVLTSLDIAVYSVGDDDAVTKRGSLDPVRDDDEARAPRNGLEAAHPVDQFFAWVENLPEEIYPDELVPIARRHVDGVAGFPAGRGLYAECGWDHDVPPPFPYGGLMLVGNHLDAEEPYLEKLARGEANGDPCPGASRMRFWTMLYALLDEAEIPREAIFVTNVHPALIRGSNPRGGVDAGETWLHACSDLLRRQILVMQPSIVAAMGVPAQRFLSEMFDVDWPLVPSSVATSLGGHEIAAAAIRHPSASQSLEDRSRTAEVLRHALEER